MKYSQIAFAVLAATLLTSCATNDTAPAPTPPAPQATVVTDSSPGRVAQAEVVTVTAIVEKIDREQRVVTLRTADGEKTILHVGDEVRNLAQVEVGDEVAVGYMESFAIEVNKGAGELGVVAGEEVVRAAPGERPMAATAETVRVTARIVEIDRENDEITLEGKEGRRVTIDVRDPKHYEAIAVGDLVDLTYTTAVAVVVEPTGAD
jgi:hypothetical protein